MLQLLQMSQQKVTSRNHKVILEPFDRVHRRQDPMYQTGAPHL